MILLILMYVHMFRHKHIYSQKIFLVLQDLYANNLLLLDFAPIITIMGIKLNHNKYKRHFYYKST